MRKLLLDSLPADAIRWGKKLTAARALGDARHVLHFDDGSTVTTDLLVGGDGAWSRIRPLVSSAKPLSAGISFIELYVTPSAPNHAAAAKLVGNGALFALAPDHGVLAHRENDGKLHIYVAVRAPESWLSSIDFTDLPAAKRAVLAKFEGWAPELRAIIEDAEAPLLPRHIHALPVGHRWAPRHGVTLLGDAAHLMSPFAGEGANLAMFDGAELGRAMVKHGKDVGAALGEYEATMFTRSEKSALESVEGLEKCFGADAPHGLVTMFAG